jgi:CrcB protein
VGGALGALARYLLAGWVQARLPHAWASFPLGTLVINVTGSFLLAFVVTLAARGLVPPAWRVTVGTGFVGAYTTFSTFELESDVLLRGGQVAWLVLYVLGNLVPGYLGVLLGRALAERV